MPAMYIVGAPFTRVIGSSLVNQRSPGVRQIRSARAFLSGPATFCLIFSANWSRALEIHMKPVLQDAPRCTIYKVDHCSSPAHHRASQFYLIRLQDRAGHVCLEPRGQSSENVKYCLDNLDQLIVKENKGVRTLVTQNERK